MTLEESITGLLTVLVHPDNEKLKNRLRNALRQFAESIAAKASEGREKPEEIPAWKCDCGRVFTCDGYHSHKKYMASINQHCEKPPEPKPEQCMCGTVNICMQHAKQYPPTDELPKEVKDAICYYSNVILGMGIDPTKAAHDEIDGYMTKVARLCFEIASRGRG